MIELTVTADGRLHYTEFETEEEVMSIIEKWVNGEYGEKEVLSLPCVTKFANKREVSRWFVRWADIVSFEYSSTEGGDE